MKYRTLLIKGKGRGKKLGFPTVNLQIPTSLNTKHGIYACWVWIGRKRYKGALHFGPIPTYADPQVSLEIFILNFQEVKQVSSITFELKHYLRPVKQFSSARQLTDQIKNDVKQVESLLKA